jgi:hypothetical protein
VLENVRAAAIPDADPQRIETRKNVELGDGEPVEPRKPSGVTHDDGVEPPAATRPPGGRAVFVSVAAKPLAERTRELGREGAGADSRRVRLGDAQRSGEKPGRDTGTGERSPGDAVRGRHVGIGAVVHVQHGPLRSFEEHAFARTNLPVEEQRRVGHMRPQSLPDPQIRCEDPVEVERLLAEHGTQVGVLLLEVRRQLFSKRALFQEIHDADPDARHLVFVSRADATSGGADLPGPTQTLPGQIDRLVVGQDQVRLLGDAQILVAA